MSNARGVMGASLMRNQQLSYLPVLFSADVPGTRRPYAGNLEFVGK
jgi:hypothetical protein